MQRNEPCFCGSGKKYKRCCGSRPPGTQVVVFHDDYDELEELTNRVPDLIRAGQLDDAEQVCRELKRRWPDMIDWRDRFAQLYEARGDNARAAKHYRLAAEFARTHEGFDDDGINDFLERAERLDPSSDSTAP